MTISPCVIQALRQSKGQDIVQHTWSVKPVVELASSSHGDSHASADQCNEFLIFILYFIAINCRHTADWLVGHGCCLVSQVFSFIINERKMSLKYGFVTRELYYGYYSFL